VYGWRAEVQAFKLERIVGAELLLAMV